MSKDRKDICPAYQHMRQGGEQPLWEECHLFFITCPHFIKKDECWAKWDKVAKKQQVTK